MNFNQIGQKICIIKKEGEKVRKNKQEEIYVSYDTEEHKRVEFFNELELDQDEHFQLSPDKKKERLSLFIVGRNGSGKSFFIKQYIEEFVKVFPSYPIYLFSSKNEDKNLDCIKKIKRVPLDESFVLEPMKYEDLSQSLVIFDDIDALTDRGKMKLRTEIYDLRDTILKNGRSYKIHIISTNHDSVGRDVQAPLNESDVIVFFLANYNRSLKYLLEKYIGLDDKQIKKIRKNKSRATTYIKTLPNVILQERHIMIPTIE